MTVSLPLLSAMNKPSPVLDEVRRSPRKPIPSEMIGETLGTDNDEEDDDTIDIRVLVKQISRRKRPITIDDNDFNVNGVTPTYHEDNDRRVVIAKHLDNLTQWYTDNIEKERK